MNDEGSDALAWILAILGLFAFFVLMCTLVGALFLYISVEVYGVGKFTWWFAFLIGLMLGILSTMFTVKVRK